MDGPVWVVRSMSVGQEYGLKSNEDAIAEGQSAASVENNTMGKRDVIPQHQVAGT